MAVPSVFLNGKPFGAGRMELPQILAKLDANSAAREAEKSPLLKEIYESQRKWASLTVPMKKVYFPPYSIAADHYWPDKK
jgi:hypothetical protein